MSQINAERGEPLAAIGGDTGDDSLSQGSSSGPSLRRSQSLQPSLATADSVTNEARALLEIFLTRSWSVNLAENLSAISERPRLARLLQVQGDDDDSDFDGEVASVRRLGGTTPPKVGRPVAYSDPCGRLPYSAPANLEFTDAVDGDVDDDCFVEANAENDDRLRGQRNRRRQRRGERTASTSDSAQQSAKDRADGEAAAEGDVTFDFRRQRAHTDILFNSDAVSAIDNGSRQHRGAVKGDRESRLLMQRAFNVTPSPSHSPSPSERRRLVTTQKLQQQQQQRRQIPLRKARIVSEFGRACLQHGDNTATVMPLATADSDIEDRLDHVAAMLDFVAKDFFGGGVGGSSRQESVSFCLESALEAKESRVLRGKGSEGKAPVDDATLDSLLSCLSDYDEFSRQLTKLLLDDLQAWRCVAMLYLVTRLLCQRCDGQVEKREQVKAHCLRHFDRRYAQWVLLRGGWQAVVEETEESELD